jgi:nondiscriminating glutamyl-tRNA synthetase
VRFAPSPTGSLHVGSARTALFNYLFARHCGGAFVLRIEDTDVARSEEQFEDAIVHDLQWLLGDRSGDAPPWDEGPRHPGSSVAPGQSGYGPYRQSERADLYRQRADALLRAGRAYYCFCSEERLAQVRQERLAAGLMPKYDGRCRNLAPREVEERLRSGQAATIRLRVPEGDITFTDLIRGTVTFSADAFGDFVLIRSNGRAGFNFASAVDDHLMRITHVIRGDDHLTNTARQLLIFRALEVSAPEYAHLSLILGPDGAKLSKRHGATTIRELREAGYLPAAIVNYLALLSWSHGGREFLGPDEGGWSWPSGLKTLLAKLSGSFDISRISASPVVFDRAKLDWLNHEWIMRRRPEEHVADVRQGVESVLTELNPCAAYELVRREAESIAWPLGLALQPSLVRYGDVPGVARAILKAPEYDDAMLALIAPASRALRWLASMVEKLPRLPFAPGGAEQAISAAEDLLQRYRKVGKDLGLKPREILMPLRLALTGREHGPELKFVLAALGRERVVERLNLALGTAAGMDQQDQGEAT